jgi:excisionase family DNA binding protein
MGKRKVTESDGQSDSNSPRLRSVANAAKQLSVSEDFIRQRIKDGKIKSVRLGDRAMIPAEEVDRIVRDGVE